MGLRKHAETEIELSGLLDINSDYNGMIGRAVIELAALFGAQGHSGSSAMMTLEIFNKLARFENLTPLTSNPEEWIDQSAVSGGPCWQSKRNPSAFSTDGGKSWYVLKDA